MAPTTAEQVSFGSGGTVVVGTLYRPADRAVTPGVVLAQGFSATMDWIVPDFAAAFADAGFAALTFDYRHLGVSGGEPRGLVDSGRQREDVRNALTYLRSRADIDDRRVALWGTSLGGAHVLAVAADDHRLAAVVANVPGIDLIRGMRGRYVPPHLRMSPARIAVAGACLLGHAVVDAARGMARATPHYIPVYGRPGHAVFADPELAGLFADLEDCSPTWRNEVAPRFLFTAPRLGPRVLSRISAPVLVTLARDDEVISSAFVRRAIAHVPDHEIIEFGARHFEMYHGQIRDRVIETHLQFLTRHLAPGD